MVNILMIIIITMPSKDKWHLNFWNICTCMCEKQCPHEFILIWNINCSITITVIFIKFAASFKTIEFFSLTLLLHQKYIIEKFEQSQTTPFFTKSTYLIMTTAQGKTYCVLWYYKTKLSNLIQCNFKVEFKACPSDVKTTGIIGHHLRPILSEPDSLKNWLLWCNRKFSVWIHTLKMRLV